jgi:hypothetical protein
MVLNTFASENSFVKTWILRQDGIIFFDYLQCWSYAELLPEYHSFFEVVFSSTIPTGDEKIFTVVCL